jgi:hypothetical protein
MQKIEKNEPCPCGNKKPDGSSIKFKRCCYLKGIIYYEDFEWLKNSLLTKKNLFQNSSNSELLVGTPIIQTKLRSARGILVGSGYYIRNSTETFQEFLVHQLKHGLGWQWGAVESQKTLNKRHVYFRWLQSYANFVRGKTTDKYRLGQNLYSSNANGDALMLLNFAYDIFTLRNSRQLPKNKIKELRKWDKFQGTRYEIAVAAVFVRAGFSLQWLDDRVSTTQHSEFIATHNLSGEKIAVEVKSRHRPGTYHFPGSKQTESIKTGALRKLNEALKQIPDEQSSMIFIDLNIPMESYNPTFASGVTNEILHVFDEHPIPTQKEPAKYNAVLFTNWSWHYFAKKEVKSSTLTIKSIPIFTALPLSRAVFTLIDRAIDEYGKFPYPVFD